MSDPLMTPAPAEAPPDGAEVAGKRKRMPGDPSSEAPSQAPPEATAAPAPSSGTALTATPTADPAPASSPVPVPADAERVATVTCPRCGAGYDVVANRRRSLDFCRSPRPVDGPDATCDYPLFWVTTAIELEGDDLDDDGLGRRPGTGGRRTVASRACPHCAEPNPVDATTCQHCGLSLIRPKAPPPSPPTEPLVLDVVPPAPPRKTPLWVWIVLALVTALALGLIVWAGLSD